MTQADKIKVLAELDGYTSPIHGLGIKNGESVPLPHYLTSYDAIIPLIQRQHFKIFSRVIDLVSESGNFVIDAAPEQFCDALIMAIGKWR